MQTIKLTQRALIELLRKSCELHKCDDEATVFVTENEGVMSAQYFPSDKPSRVDLEELEDRHREMTEVN